MSEAGPIGILGIEAIHYYVRDIERSRRFYTQQLDFSEIGASGAELTSAGRQRSLVFQAGACRIVCSSPAGEGGRAHRYLKKHPDGIGSILFEVEDIDRAFSTLEARGGTPVDEVRVTECDRGTFRSFVMTTPIGDTTFRFVERRGEFPLYPGFESYAVATGGKNAFGFARFDHVTSNFETMSPALLWMEHVLGFERFWQVQFHTDDVARLADRSGSGLRSAVMWDPASGVKFANNEPQRPNFKASQINVFHEDHRGDSVQHVALTVSDIVEAVRGLRSRGVEFMSTPKSYYDALAERMRGLGVGAMSEPLAALEELQILADGDGPGRYLLEIFLKDSAGLYASPDAGPFFYEIIQRHGDSGFGAGNFRALFESIERGQLADEGRR